MLFHFVLIYVWIIVFGVTFLHAFSIDDANTILCHGFGSQQKLVSVFNVYC